MDRWTDEQMDGWTDEWIDGRISKADDILRQSSSQKPCSDEATRTLGFLSLPPGLSTSLVFPSLFPALLAPSKARSVGQRPQQLPSGLPPTFFSGTVFPGLREAQICPL